MHAIVVEAQQKRSSYDI